MQKLQQGFTLIELMIVVAIIGILAALAVPAYQDYTIRSKVSEAASLASAARTAVDVYYSENSQLPPAATLHDDLGLSAASGYNAKYVSTVQVGSPGGDGEITVTLKTVPDLGSVGGTTVVYSPEIKGGNLQWRVSTGSTVPAKYRPRT